MAEVTDHQPDSIKAQHLPMATKIRVIKINEKEYVNCRLSDDSTILLPLQPAVSSEAQEVDIVFSDSDYEISHEYITEKRKKVKKKVPEDAISRKMRLARNKRYKDKRRLNPELKAIDRKRTSDCMRRKRQDETYRQIEREKDRLRRAAARKASKEVREREKERDRIKKRIQRRGTTKKRKRKSNGTTTDKRVTVKSYDSDSNTKAIKHSLSSSEDEDYEDEIENDESGEESSPENLDDDSTTAKDDSLDQDSFQTYSRVRVRKRTTPGSKESKSPDRVRRAASRKTHKEIAEAEEACDGISRVKTRRREKTSPKKRKIVDENSTNNKSTPKSKSLKAEPKQTKNDAASIDNTKTIKKENKHSKSKRKRSELMYEYLIEEYTSSEDDSQQEKEVESSVLVNFHDNSSCSEPELNGKTEYIIQEEIVSSTKPKTEEVSTDNSSYCGYVTICDDGTICNPLAGVVMENDLTAMYDYL